MRARFLAAATSLLLLLPALPVRAQDEIPENIQIGLSTDQVSITSDFSGAELTIFGALDNADPLVARQGRYDVVVVLEGPPRAVTVRKKTRVLGMWINTESVIFRDVPESYSMALTRAPQDISTPDGYKRLALGADNLHFQPLKADGDPKTIEEFTEALLQRKEALGLYSTQTGGVRFLSQSLFRASLKLAPNVAVGTHRARAYLFRNSVFLRETSAQLTIRKAGLEQRLYEFAHQNSLIYGIAAVLIAIVTGWLGRIIFRKD